MKGYIITKTIAGRFVYYLGKHDRWEGLTYNAIIIPTLAEVNKKINSLMVSQPKEQFTFEEVDYTFVD